MASESASVPHGWTIARVGDLGEVQLGKARSPGTDRGPNMVPYLRVANVLDGVIDYSDVNRMHFSPVEQQRYTLHQGDILLNEGQSTELVGRSAIYEGPEASYCYQNSLVNFRCGTLILPRFAHAVFKRWLDTGHFTTIVKQTTSMAHLGAQRFAGLSLHLPPTLEQREIAAVLDTVDETIHKTEQIIEKLKQMKLGLLHDLLTRGIDENGELRDPERHPEQFKGSELGRIPSAWEIRRIGDIANVVRGSTPRPAKDPRYFSGNYVPWITVGELSRDEWPFLLDTSSMLTELGSRLSRRLEEGTVVISNSGFGCGVPKILSLSGCANDGIAAFLDLSPECSCLFLYYFLFSRTMYLRTRVARGVDQPNLNTDLLREVAVLLPSVREQEEIAARLFCLASRARNEETSLAKLRLLKTALMDDLLTGRVRTTSLQETTP